MKKLLVMAMICIAAVAAQAQKGELTDEQKAVRKEMLEKYDTNKDGKLSKEERSKMTAEDKTKWEKAFPKKKKKTEDSSAAAPVTPATPSK